jgi:hypothetical protein
MVAGVTYRRAVRAFPPFGPNGTDLKHVAAALAELTKKTWRVDYVRRRLIGRPLPPVPCVLAVREAGPFIDGAGHYVAWCGRRVYDPTFSYPESLKEFVAETGFDWLGALVRPAVDSGVAPARGVGRLARRGQVGRRGPFGGASRAGQEGRIPAPISRFSGASISAKTTMWPQRNHGAFSSRNRCSNPAFRMNGHEGGAVIVGRRRPRGNQEGLPGGASRDPAGSRVRGRRSRRERAGLAVLGAVAVVSGLLAAGLLAALLSGW